MDPSWESDLLSLLNDLLAVQDELLAHLGQKRELLRTADLPGLAAIAPQEDRLIGRLQECLRHREQLLARAGREGLPTENIRALAAALPQSRRGHLEEGLRSAGAKARLLRHQGLVHWVVIQRTLLHLSQMLEIIATGGRLQPTYGGGEPVHQSGALVDKAA